MTYEKFRLRRYSIVKSHLNTVIELADQMSHVESEMVKVLKEIDTNKYYTITGYKSLLGFCCNTLRLSQTQALRIVTLVRRSEPTPNIGEKVPPSTDARSNAFVNATQANANSNG